MPEVTYSVVINRPISEVFRVVTDIQQATKWQPDLAEVHQSDEKMRLGIMVTQVRNTHLFSWRLDLNVDIVDYTPNRLIAYKGVLGRFPVAGRIEFETGGAGSTKITESMTIRMGFLYGLFSPMMRGTMTKRTRKALESLKALLETRSSAASSTTDFHKQL